MTIIPLQSACYIQHTASVPYRFRFCYCEVTTYSWLHKETTQKRQYCVTVLQCYSSKIKLWRVNNKLYIYIYIYKYRSIFRGLTNLFENCNTVTSVTVKSAHKKNSKSSFFFAKTFENRNAAAVPLQRQFERRKFALLLEKNYGPTREQKFQSKCDTRES